MSDTSLRHRAGSRDYRLVPERKRLFVSPLAEPPRLSTLVYPDTDRLQTDWVVERAEGPRRDKLNSRDHVCRFVNGQPRWDMAVPDRIRVADATAFVRHPDLLQIGSCAWSRRVLEDGQANAVSGRLRVSCARSCVSIP